MSWAIQDVELPVRLRPSVPMSDDELMAFSESNKPCKVERLASGEILLKSPDGFESSRREAYVVHQLFAWAESDGRGEAFSSNAGFNLPDGSTLSPDAGWVESNRLTVLSEYEQERYLPFAPDFLVEMLSQSDSLSDLDAKMEQWIANGARLAWRIDPYGGTVAIYSADGSPLTLDRPEIVEGTGPVVGFQLNMAKVWT